MNWLARWIIAMGLVYAAALSVWDARWAILAGGFAFAVVGLVLLSPRGR